MFDVNWAFLIFYSLCVTANGINIAWTNGGNNQTASVFAAKLNWTPDETRLYNSLINLASQIGKAVGATYGGQLISSGRKKQYLIYNVASIIACVVMQFIWVPALVFGKLIHGFSITVVHMAAVKMLNETVPVYYLGSFGPLVQGLMATGYGLTFGLGIFLP